MEYSNTSEDEVSQAFKQVQATLTKAIGTSSNVRVQGKLELQQEAMLAFPDEHARGELT